MTWNEGPKAGTEPKTLLMHECALTTQLTRCSYSSVLSEFHIVECEPQFADVCISVCVNVMTCNVGATVRKGK